MRAGAVVVAAALLLFAGPTHADNSSRDELGYGFYFLPRPVGGTWGTSTWTPRGGGKGESADFSGYTVDLDVNFVVTLPGDYFGVGATGGIAVNFGGSGAPSGYYLGGTFMFAPTPLIIVKAELDWCRLNGSLHPTDASAPMPTYGGLDALRVGAGVMFIVPTKGRQYAFTLDYLRLVTITPGDDGNGGAIDVGANTLLAGFTLVFGV